MTVFEFETWRKWYLHPNKGKDRMNAWFDLPLTDSNMVRESINPNLVWYENASDDM